MNAEAASLAVIARSRARTDFRMSTPHVNAFMRQVPLLCENDPENQLLSPCLRRRPP